MKEGCNMKNFSTLCKNGLAHKDVVFIPKMFDGRILNMLSQNSLDYTFLKNLDFKSGNVCYIRTVFKNI
jgi:hypothetical protein